MSSAAWFVELSREVAADPGALKRLCDDPDAPALLAAAGEDVERLQARVLQLEAQADDVLLKSRMTASIWNSGGPEDATTGIGL